MLILLMIAMHFDIVVVGEPGAPKLLEAKVATTPEIGVDLFILATLLSLALTHIQMLYHRRALYAHEARLLRAAASRHVAAALGYLDDSDDASLPSAAAAAASAAEKAHALGGALGGSGLAALPPSGLDPAQGYVPSPRRVDSGRSSAEDARGVGSLGSSPLGGQGLGAGGGLDPAKRLLLTAAGAHITVHRTSFEATGLYLCRKHAGPALPLSFWLRMLVRLMKPEPCVALPSPFRGLPLAFH